MTKAMQQAKCVPEGHRREWLASVHAAGAAAASIMQVWLLTDRYTTYVLTATCTTYYIHTTMRSCGKYFSLSHKQVKRIYSTCLPLQSSKK